jgi:acetyl esterase
MPLDPQMRQLLEEIQAQKLPPIYNIPIAEARRRLLKMVVYPGLFYDGIETRDLLLKAPGRTIPIRIYLPSGHSPAPVGMFFHGGGWVTGCLETHDGFCRALAHQSKCAIVAVDYRLAPEHPYPAAVEDAWFATSWIARQAERLNLDASRIAVLGDSSGGTLAAAVSQLARKRGKLGLAGQVLMYPALDHWNAGTESYREYGTDYPLTTEAMKWFWNQYVPDQGQWNDPIAFPSKCPEFKGLPATLVVTAEYDILRDEAEIYAKKLRDAAVSVTLSRYDGMLHGFLIHFPILDKAKAALAEIASFLRACLVKADLERKGLADSARTRR